MGGVLHGSVDIVNQEWSGKPQLYGHVGLDPGSKFDHSVLSRHRSMAGRALPPIRNFLRQKKYGRPKAPVQYSLKLID
jgi:hypothetical protein